MPYNPWLSIKLNPHINVEVYAQVKCIKYLHKYLYKGYDGATVRLQTENKFIDHDEILIYLVSKYVSPSEALGMLKEFPMSETSHTLVRLAVHLPNQQQIAYQECQEIQVIEQAAKKCTGLTAWFELNQTDSEAHNYSDTDIPHHYRFEKKIGKDDNEEAKT